MWVSHADHRCELNCNVYAIIPWDQCIATLKQLHVDPYNCVECQNSQNSIVGDQSLNTVRRFMIESLWGIDDIIFLH